MSERGQVKELARPREQGSWSTKRSLVAAAAVGDRSASDGLCPVPAGRREPLVMLEHRVKTSAARIAL